MIMIIVVVLVVRVVVVVVVVVVVPDVILRGHHLLIIRAFTIEVSNAIDAEGGMEGNKVAERTAWKNGRRRDEGWREREGNDV